MRFRFRLSLPEMSIPKKPSSNGNIIGSFRSIKIYCPLTETTEELQISARTTRDEIHHVLLAIAQAPDDTDMIPKLLFNDVSVDFLSIPDSPSPLVLVLEPSQAPVTALGTISSLKSNIETASSKLGAIDIDKLNFGESYPMRQRRTYKKAEIQRWTNKYRFSDDIRASLKLPSFNNWEWDSNELVMLIVQIFYDLGLVEYFKIDTYALYTFILTCRDSYNCTVWLF